MEQRAFILIADITGYTAYLSESELEHAQGTLTDLLELLIGQTKPPLVISRLEGDAVISYALSDGYVSGQTLMEQIEDTYVEFRKAIELMVLNNSCQCNACANVSNLDLKFFLHYGTFVLQRLADREEMMGSDVNLIHRLLKNSVSAKTGIRAYMLCTEAAVEALGLGEDDEGAVSHVERVPDFGEMTLWVRDMHPVYAERSASSVPLLPDDEVLASFSTVIDLPIEVVWDYLNQSHYRNVIIGSDRQDVIDRSQGRIGQGSTYVCFHGKKAMSQVVLEWEPFDRVVVDTMLPLPGKPAYALMSFELEPSERGTRLTQSAGRTRGPVIKRILGRLMLFMVRNSGQRDVDDFKKAIEDDYASRGSGAPAIEITPELVSAAAAARLKNIGSSDD